MIPSLENKYHENKQLSSPCEKNVKRFYPLCTCFSMHTPSDKGPTPVSLFLDKPILKHFFNNSAADRQTARG